MKTKFFIWAITLPAFLAAGCSNEEPDTQRRDIDMSRAEQQVINTQQTFAFNLLNEGLENSEANVAFSPLSVSMSLSMTANGTEGEMQREILNALDFDSDDDLEVMNGCARRLMNELPALDNRTSVVIAQSVWTNDKVVLEEPFRNVCASNYGASFGNYSNQQEGAAEISRWIESATRGMIKNALVAGDMGDIAIVNATYFKGQWTKQFKKNNTKRLTFNNADGSKPIVDMMSDTKEGYDYWDNDDLQMVSLPYGNGSYSMCVILPREDKTLSEVMSGMDHGKWTRLQNSMVSCSVHLKLPRFSFQTSNDIRRTLRNLGVNKLWEETAANLTAPDVVMNKFIHNVRIIVDEEGTVAAAASSGMGGELAPSPGDTVEMNCNRPFAFVIQERSTGAILFIGAVNRLV